MFPMNLSDDPFLDSQNDELDPFPNDFNIHDAIITDAIIETEIPDTSIIDFGKRSKHLALQLPGAIVDRTLTPIEVSLLERLYNLNKNIMRKMDTRIRVAVYRGKGAISKSWMNVVHVLLCANDVFRVEAVSTLVYLTRDSYDVVFIPGGIASTMRNVYRRKNYSMSSILHQFIRRGGGFVGTCAGAYLAAMLDLTNWKHSHGIGIGYISNTTGFQGIENSKLYYAWGPIFKMNSTSDDPPFGESQVLLRIAKRDNRFFLHHSMNSKTKSLYQGFAERPIIVKNNFFNGTVVISAVHPETDISQSNEFNFDFSAVPSDCDSGQAKLLQSMVLTAFRK